MGGESESGGEQVSAHPWLAVEALAQTLAEAGESVTQLHCTAEDCPAGWEFAGCGAHVFPAAEANMVITTDGARHLVSESTP